MRWPKLVLPFTQSMPVEADIDLDGLDEDGAPLVGVTWRGKGNWQDATAEVYSRDHATTEVRAHLYIDGDPFAGVATIAGGTVRAFGEEHRIVQGCKARNPDATVNYTRLDLR